MTAQQKVADSLVGASWFSWFFANIGEINQLLQFFALVIAILASCVAIRFHTKR